MKDACMVTTEEGDIGVYDYALFDYLDNALELPDDQIEQSLERLLMLIPPIRKGKCCSTCLFLGEIRV